MSKQHSIAEARRNLPDLVKKAEAGKAVELTRARQSVRPRDAGVSLKSLARGDSVHRLAAERARLAARGETPAFVDGQIAAIARRHDVTLVTFNAGDFRRFDGLTVVSW